MTRITLSIILLLTLLPACNRKTTEATEQTPTPHQPSTHPYYPHHQGKVWTYKDQGDRIINLEVVNASPTGFEVQVSNPNISLIVYKVEEGGIYLSQDVIPDKEITFTYRPPVPYLKSELKPGDSWNHEGIGMYDNTRKDEISVGEEVEVTVPAGTFQALPVHRRIQKGERLDEETEYWVKDVGLVKSDYRSGDYHSVLELAEVK